MIRRPFSVRSTRLPNPTLELVDWVRGEGTCGELFKQLMPVPGAVLMSAPDVEPQFAAPLRAAGLRVQTGHAVPIRATVAGCGGPRRTRTHVDGHRIVRALRAAASDPGILVLVSSAAATTTTPAPFETGADDVLGVPAGAQEAVARVRALAMTSARLGVRTPRSLLCSLRLDRGDGQPTVAAPPPR